MGDCLRVVFAGGALQLAFVADVVVGGELAHQVFLPDSVEIGVFKRVDGRQPIPWVHFQ